MAKLDTYGSPPTCSLFNDWNLTSESFCNGDFGIVDPDPIELFEDLNDWPPSIFGDIKKIQSDTSAASGGSVNGGDDAPYIDFFEPELKPEIRNIDCMWSASSSSSSVLSSVQRDALTGGGSSSSNSVATAAVPLAAVIENAQNISNNKQQSQSPAMYQRLGSKVASHEAQLKAAAAVDAVYIKNEPIDDDYEQQLQQHSILNSRTALLAQQQQQQLQHIKPGMSLLRKSNAAQQGHTPPTQQQQQQQKKFNGSIKIPAKTTADFLRERDHLTSAATKSATSAAFGRPDTPLSLDDDPAAPEFKHNVDLRACLMGSNNISLVAADPANIINSLSEQLQDTTKNRIDLCNLMPAAGCDFADVLDLIVKDDRSLEASSSVRVKTELSFDSDEEQQEEEEEEEEEEDDDDEYEDDLGSSCESAASSTSSSRLNCSLSSSAAGLNNSTSAYASAASSLSGNVSVSGGSSQPQQTFPMMMHSDHSYTRCNEDLGTNLETPSDSDEEIDVVSIGDKKLPTNPSDKDRRALQHKVAHKFSNARIVKTANGVRTIPPRRRITVELPYTPASSSPVKSVANSRYPSPSATPYHNQFTTKYVQQQTQHMMSVISGSGGVGGGEKHRKRIAATGASLAAPTAAAGGSIKATVHGSSSSASSGGGFFEYLPPAKKHRTSKKQKQQHGDYGSASVAGSAASTPTLSGFVKRHYSLDEAADSLEKRNLHNDMERQRRIGLKNLFEALKKQIPSIREKERAPKVNILREAAKLCEALTREDQLLTEQKMRLKEQMRRRQELLARLRAGGSRICIQRD